MIVVIQFYLSFTNLHSAASLHIKSKCASYHDRYISAICICTFLTHLIVMIIILEYACRFRASSPDFTPVKALHKAYSRCKESGTHKAVRERFSRSRKQYSFMEFTEFIFQNRLWQFISMFSVASQHMLPFVWIGFESINMYSVANQSSYCAVTAKTMPHYTQVITYQTWRRESGRQEEPRWWPILLCRRRRRVLSAPNSCARFWWNVHETNGSLDRQDDTSTPNYQWDFAAHEWIDLDGRSRYIRKSRTRWYFMINTLLGDKPNKNNKYAIMHTMEIPCVVAAQST